MDQAQNKMGELGKFKSEKWKMKEVSHYLTQVSFFKKWVSLALSF